MKIWMFDGGASAEVEDESKLVLENLKRNPNSKIIVIFKRFRQASKRAFWVA